MTRRVVGVWWCWSCVYVVLVCVRCVCVCVRMELLRMHEGNMRIHPPHPPVLTSCLTQPEMHVMVRCECLARHKKGCMRVWHVSAACVCMCVLCVVCVCCVCACVSVCAVLCCVVKIVAAKDKD